MLPVAFLGVMGECHHGGVGMVRRVTILGGTGTRSYSHIVEHSNAGKFHFVNYK